MDKDSAGIVHRRHLDPILVEGEVHLDKDTLESFHQRPDGSSLNCLGLHQVAAAHFYKFGATCLNPIEHSSQDVSTQEFNDVDKHIDIRDI
jgi:hypothetical protein